jgi:formyl-CoA transferase
MSAADPDTFSAPPLLGQHTIAVLQEVLGYEDSKINQLIADRAIEQAE